MGEAFLAPAFGNALFNKCVKITAVLRMTCFTQSRLLRPFLYQFQRCAKGELNSVTYWRSVLGRMGRERTEFILKLDEQELGGEGGVRAPNLAI